MKGDGGEGGVVKGSVVMGMCGEGGMVKWEVL